ncbi:hypothetical protein CDAR_165691 [Caerostris darwini]|uniref:Uncharacterized protein n=1 Tax=Caerostris darwini TaxID=1538125 RepID=A0AAV4WAS0_9ARAC|nr:hypothetical protein CDAR_165691 [Caerostris darwini]
MVVNRGICLRKVGFGLSKGICKLVTCNTTVTRYPPQGNIASAFYQGIGEGDQLLENTKPVSNRCATQPAPTNTKLLNILCPFCSQPPALFRCFCYTLQRDHEHFFPVSSLQHIHKKQRAVAAIKTISTNNDSKFCSGHLKQGLRRSFRNASLFLSRPMPGQSCGRELPFGWLHLQLKNLGSPIRFLLDGFTTCGQSILPEKGGKQGFHPKCFPILITAHAEAASRKRAASWMASLATREYRESYFLVERVHYASVTRSREIPNISILVSSLQLIRKKQRAVAVIKTISTNNGSKFCSGLLKQGLQCSIRNSSLFLSRPMPGQPCGRELPFGWLHLQLKNLRSPIRFLLDGFTVCCEPILPQKREGEGRW